MMPGLGSMIDAIEFPSLALRFFGESPKQHVQVSIKHCSGFLPPKISPFTEIESTNYHHAGKRSSNGNYIGQ